MARSAHPLWTHRVAVGVTLLAQLVLAELTLTGRPVREDAAQNVAMGYHMLKHGVPSLSLSDADPGARGGEGLREPAYPVLLSLAWRWAVDDGVTLSGFLDADPAGDGARLALKRINVLLFLGLSLAVYCLAMSYTGDRCLALVCLCLIGLSAVFVGRLDSHYSELPAAFFLTLHVGALVAALKGPRRQVWLLSLSGASLACLILTKAAFSYLWLILLTAAVVRLGVRPKSVSRRRLVTGAAALLVPGLVLVGAWLWITQQRTGVAAVSQRGGLVMAVRAQYDLMGWRDYWLTYLVFTRPLAESRILGRAVAPARLEQFDRPGVKGRTHRLALSEHGDVFSRAGFTTAATPLTAESNRDLQREALSAFRRRWMMHTALVPAFAYRGMWLPVGLGESAAQLGRLISVPMIGLTAVWTAALFPFFVAGLLGVIRDRHWTRLLLHLPVIYSIGVHSVLTHSLPRYNVPLVPLLLVASIEPAARAVRSLAAIVHRLGLGGRRAPVRS